MNHQTYLRLYSLQYKKYNDSKVYTYTVSSQITTLFYETKRNDESNGYNRGEHHYGNRFVIVWADGRKVGRVFYSYKLVNLVSCLYK